MDRNVKDDSPDRRREEALARRMGKALDELAASIAGAPSGASCPDAEQIAAYYSKELAPRESAECEAHFAGCSRCRKILAVLAASADTPLAENDVAHLGQLAAAARVPDIGVRQITAVPRSKRFGWRMRWLAPALGAAAAIALWFAIRPPWRTLNPPRQDASSLVAQANKNEVLVPATPAPPNEPSQTSPAKKDADSLARSADARRPSPAPVEPPKIAEASPDRSTASNSGSDESAKAFAPRAATNAAPDEPKQSADVNSAPSGTANVPPTPPSPSALSATRSAVPLPAPAAQPTPSSESQAAREPQAPASSGQPVTVTGQAPIVASGGIAGAAVARDKQARPAQREVTDLPLNGRNFSALELAQAPSVMVRVPAGGVIWRAGRGGAIERSVNAGGTWTPQTSPLHEDWLAGAAVSESICWLAGRNGAIARTTDGEHWETVPAPPAAPDTSGKMPDFTGIKATDSQRATVTASDGRRFATQDGGRTWQAQQN